MILCFASYFLLSIPILFLMCLSLKTPGVPRYWSSSPFHSLVSSNPSILFNSSHLRIVTRQARCRHAHLEITFQPPYHLFYLPDASGHGRSAPGPGEHRLVKGNYRSPQGRSQVEVRQVTAADGSDHHTPNWIYWIVNRMEEVLKVVQEGLEPWCLLSPAQVNPPEGHLEHSLL